MLAMVIGGSGSGKSEYAENLAMKLSPGRKLYLATMYPWDEESKQKIQRHRAMRAKKNFDTLECFCDLTTGIEEYCQQEHRETIATAFLDCMSNLVANELYCENGYESKKGWQKTGTVEEYVLNGIEQLCKRFEHVIIVSNDVFCDGERYDEEMQRYQKHLARVNTKIAQRADFVIEVVCGIPLIHKREGEKRDERLLE